ncbi:hypothetical protein F5141DRAFT_822224 [Pisolithus sp. B1]|nr:hypothetical protein F5141DRAFT_822224 [Pisolithus sp. B1]
MDTKNRYKPKERPECSDFSGWQCAHRSALKVGPSPIRPIGRYDGRTARTHLRCAISFIDFSLAHPHLQYTMSTAAEEELQALYDDLWQNRIVNYVTISCVAFLVYDILTNLDREVPLIWRYYNNANNDEHLSWRGRARRILVQMLFVFGRYYALLYLVGGEILYTTLVNVILVIRLNAMYQIFYGKKGLRRHQVFLASVVVLEFLAELIVCIITVTWIEKRVIAPPTGVPWQGCMLSADTNTALTLPGWGIAILVATIFLGLTLHLLYSSLRLRFERFRDFTISNIKKEIRNIQPMTLTMIRDSVLFYFPMFGVLVASVPVTALYRTALATVTAPIILALYSFCASRLIIHTRESFARPPQDLSSRETEPINFVSQSLMASHARMHA